MLMDDTLANRKSKIQRGVCSVRQRAYIFCLFSYYCILPYLALPKQSKNDMSWTHGSRAWHGDAIEAGSLEAGQPVDALCLFLLLLLVSVSVSVFLSSFSFPFSFSFSFSRLTPFLFKLDFDFDFDY